MIPMYFMPFPALSGPLYAFSGLPWWVILSPGLKRLQGLFGYLDLIDTACRFRAGAMIEKKPTVASVTHTTIGFLAVVACISAFCGHSSRNIPKML